MLNQLNSACTWCININVWIRQPMHSHNANTDRKVTHRETHILYTHTLKATLTKIAVLFTQNPNVISHTNANMHVCNSARTHTHTYSVNIDQTDRAVTFLSPGSSLISAHSHSQTKRSVSAAAGLCSDLHTLTHTTSSHTVRATTQQYI